MRINIINLDKEGWILTKFAKRMNLQLNELGHTSFLTKSPRTDVDVNHSIIFLFLHKDIDFFPPNRDYKDELSYFVCLKCFSELNKKIKIKNIINRSIYGKFI